jgi:hypothetical protein
VVSAESLFASAVVVGFGLPSLDFVGVGVLVVGVGSSCVLVVGVGSSCVLLLDGAGSPSCTMTEPVVVDNSSRLLELSHIWTKSKVSGVVPASRGVNVNVAIVMFPLRDSQ